MKLEWVLSSGVTNGYVCWSLYETSEIEHNKLGYYRMYAIISSPIKGEKPGWYMRHLYTPKGEIGGMYIALERLPIDDAKAAIKAWVLLNIDVEGLLGENQ